MATKRLYVGNLPDDTSELDVKTFFKPYQVSGVEIKRKTFSDKTTVFAYVDILENNVDNCLQSSRCKKWKNSIVKVELAKESFLERLKKERSNRNDELSDAATNSVSSIQNNGDNGFAKNKKIVFNFDDDEKNDPNDGQSHKRVFLQNQEDDINSVSSGTKDETVPHKRKLPMFRGIDAFQEPSEECQPHAETVMKRFEEFSDFWRDGPDSVMYSHNSKAFSSMNNSYNVSPPPSKNSKFLAESKRLQALDERRTSWKSKKDAVKKSLKNFGNNTKIIFDDSSYYEKVEEQEIPVSKITLFENDSEDDDFRANFDTGKNLDEKHKLKVLNMKLQSSNDDRFKIDERFYEDIANVTDDRNSNFKDKPKFCKNGEFTDAFRNRSMIRYDPTKSDHKVPEKNSQTSVLVQKKKKTTKKKLEKQKPEQDGNATVESSAPKISPEKHYSISTNLRDVFNKSNDGSEFRLSTLFDEKLKLDEKSIDQPIASFTSTKKIKMVENPLESDDESSSEDVTTEDAPIDIPSTISSEKILGKCGVWGETFFFKPNDSRLQEAVEFYRKSDKCKNVDFNKKRTKLRSIVRKKIQNSKRDSKLFKQKLGSTKMNKSKFKIRLRRARV